MSPRVLSYPPVHDYVDRLHDNAARLVHRDEPWPELPHLYDPAWLEAHRSDWDVAHFHFTWEQYAPDRFADVLATHRRHGTPIVWTAHDLRNPHTTDGSADARYLRLLADAADHVLTLTPGAAATIRRQFERVAEVVPHGPMLTETTARRWRTRRREERAAEDSSVFRLYLHAKSLRANLDWQTPMQVVARMGARGVPVRLDVGVHDGHPDPKALATDHVRIRPHAWLSRDALIQRLIRADALLLPYRWGTHSGLLELASDLGVPVIASEIGFLRDQGATRLVAVDAQRVRPEALARAIEDAMSLDAPPTPWHRREQARRTFVDRHRALYAALVPQR